VDLPDWSHSPEADSDDEPRLSLYTLVDNLLMLTAVGVSDRLEFSGKMPWSFWQTYKCMVGLKRSISSLNHHWNGATRRRYEVFLTRGKFSDCVL
jgi:hypothetical protein